MTKNKRKSVRWSSKDILKIKQFIKEAGGDEYKGMKAAAEHFNVTYNAVYGRMWKIKKGLYMSTINSKKTSKIPMEGRKKRESIKKVVEKPSKPTRSISLDIKNIDIDLAKGKLTINY